MKHLRHKVTIQDIPRRTESRRGKMEYDSVSYSTIRSVGLVAAGEMDDQKLVPDKQIPKTREKAPGEGRTSLSFPTNCDLHPQCSLY